MLCYGGTSGGSRGCNETVDRWSLPTERLVNHDLTQPEFVGAGMFPQVTAAVLVGSSQGILNVASRHEIIYSNSVPCIWGCSLPSVYTGWPKTVSRILLSVSSPIPPARSVEICNKVVLYHHTLTASIHYNVKYNFSKITIMATNTCAKTYLIKQLFTNFLI